MKAARRIASPNVGTGNGEMKFDIIEGALTNDFDTVVNGGAKVGHWAAQK